MAGGQPEWANQVHRVRPGEQIEIRPDTLAERGELAPVEREKSGGSSTETSPSDDLTAAETEKAHLRNAEHVDEKTRTPPHTGGPTPPTESQKEENPPDGDELVNEWKEGNHRVVERRLGLDEEVHDLAFLHRTRR